VTPVQASIGEITRPDGVALDHRLRQAGRG
jgi:hypothetical protein